MRFCDGRVINGVAKEKGIAADEYARALQEGKASGLVESVTDDGELLRSDHLNSYDPFTR